MHGRTNSPRSLAMMIASMLIFGSIGVFRRYIPLSSAFLASARGILGGLSVLAFMKLTGKGGGGRMPLRTFLPLVLTGAAIGINWMLLFEAFNHTTVAVATLCYYMQPTIVILLSPLLFREKMTARKTACAAVSILGMILVSGVGGGSDPRSGSPQGILLGLGAAVFYSIVVIMNKRLSGIDARRKTAVQLFAAGAVMMPYLLFSGFPGREAFTPASVLLLLAVGILHTGIAYLLYFGSMDGLTVQSVAILSYIDPVSALLFSAVFLREPLSLPGLIGAVLIIGSAIAAERADRRPGGQPEGG